MVDIGSSEAAAVMGVSPFKTPWRLWAEKVGLISDETEETEPMLRGRQLERQVLYMFFEEMGFALKDTVVSPDTTRWRQERPWQRSTPDCVYEGRALVEIKCVVGMAPSVPRIDWLVQCLHQRMVYPEAERQYLVAFGGLHLEWWSIPKHIGAQDRVLREEERFLELVEKQIPPPVRAEDASVLAKAWPIVKPYVAELPPEALEWDREYRESVRAIAEQTERKKLAQARLESVIKDAEEAALIVDGRLEARYTWKPYEKKEYTVKAQTVRPLKRKGGKDENGDTENISW